MATRSLSISKCLEPIPLRASVDLPFPDLKSLRSPRIGFEAGDGGAAGMPILIIVTLWLLCTLLLVFLLCSFYKALCRFSPASRTAAAAAASATTAVSVTASVDDGAAASRDVLSRLPVFAYSSAAQKKQLSCSVCLSDFKEGERGRFLPRCFHCYHVECVDEWLALHSACPVCRASIDAEAAQPPV